LRPLLVRSGLPAEISSSFISRVNRKYAFAAATRRR
jgi:hypothetical protein